MDLILDGNHFVPSLLLEHTEIPAQIHGGDISEFFSNGSSAATQLRQVLFQCIFRSPGNYLGCPENLYQIDSLVEKLTKETNIVY